MTDFRGANGEKCARRSQPAVEALLLEDASILDASRGIITGDVQIRNGQIAGVGSLDADTTRNTERLDCRGRLLTPGLIDLHTHGIGHHLYALGRDELMAGVKCLAQFGVTTVTPTIVPQIGSAWLEKITEIAQTISEIEEVNVPGLHLEGPFLAIKGSAAPTLTGDLVLLEEIIAACCGRLQIMSVSPETPGILPVIRRLRENNITVFITHTRASVEQAEAAFAAGAIHATHFYDVFYSPAERDLGVRPVGVVEAVLAERSVSVDFIADGIHVHPAAIRAAIAAKGPRGVVLITDSIIGAGLPPAIYDTPWGFQVRVREGDAPRHLSENFLAGSSLTMDRGMANLLKWLDLPSNEIWSMGTSNPARVIGLNCTGRIEVGLDADLVLWDTGMKAAKTWVRGKCVYSSDRTVGGALG